MDTVFKIKTPLKELFAVIFSFFAFGIFLSTASAHTMVANGDAQIDTAQSKFGGASGLFDGTGDYVHTDYDADFNVGTGQFAVAGWFRINAYSDSNIIRAGVSGTDFSWAMTVINSGANMNFYWSTTGTAGNYVGAATSISTGTWYHFELDRNSAGAGKLRLNGTTIADDSPNSMVGQSLYVPSTNGVDIGIVFNGWIDDLIFVKGSVLNENDFTVPSAAYDQCSISNVKLLLHMDGTDGSTTFIDDSTTACGGGGAPYRAPDIFIIQGDD